MVRKPNRSSLESSKSRTSFPHLGTWIVRPLLVICDETSSQNACSRWWIQRHVQCMMPNATRSVPKPRTPTCRAHRTSYGALHATCIGSYHTNLTSLQTFTLPRECQNICVTTSFLHSLLKRFSIVRRVSESRPLKNTQLAPPANLHVFQHVMSAYRSPDKRRTLNSHVVFL